MSEDKKSAAGRPTTYTEETANKICERIALGDPLRVISEMDDMPVLSTIFLWLTKHKEFSDKYDRAKEEQGELFADQITEIADEKPERMSNAQGSKVIDPGWVSLQRLRIDSRKWTASKLRPKKYGDRMVIEDDRNLAKIDVPKRESREKWLSKQGK